MKFLNKIVDAGDVYAHCDLMCGVYDPIQARIEAQSVYNATKLYQDSDDDIFRQRAVAIKEDRAERVKHHLWILWTDYFKEEHLDEFTALHDLFWRATKAAGKAKKSMDLATSKKLIDLIDEIGRIFEKTKEGYSYDAAVKNIEIQAK